MVEGVEWNTTMILANHDTGAGNQGAQGRAKRHRVLVQNVQGQPTCFQSLRTSQSLREVCLLISMTESLGLPTLSRLDSYTTCGIMGLFFAQE